MKFWKGNRLDGEFSWPVDAVAGAFMTYYWQNELQHSQMPLERHLRLWLTASDGFNSVWEAETGPDSFEALYALVRERAMAGAPDPVPEPPAPGPILLAGGRAASQNLYIQQGKALYKVSTLYPGENRMTAQVCFDHSGDMPGRTTVRQLTREQAGHWKPASAQIVSRYHRALDRA